MANDPTAAPALRAARFLKALKQPVDNSRPKSSLFTEGGQRPVLLL